MKIVEYQKWDFHEAKKYIEINENEIIYSYVIDTFKNEYFALCNDVELSSLYIQPKYRNKGIFYEIMKDIFEEYKNYNIIISVRKKSFIEEKYKRLGFKFLKNIDKEFRWLKKEKEIIKFNA